MKTSVVALVIVALVALSAGAWLHQVLRSPDPAPSAQPPEAPAPKTSDALEARIDFLSRRIDALSSRIESLQSQNASEWLRVDERLAKRSASESGGSLEAIGADGSPAPLSAAGVEAIRTRWRESLDLKERTVLQLDPAGWNSKDLVTWSRLDELKKARAVLGDAKDEAALRRLAKSREFGVYFPWEDPASPSDSTAQPR